MIQKVQNLIKYDLVSFILKFSDFSGFKKDQIFAFYQGKSKNINSSILSELSDLIKESDLIQSKLDSVKLKLNELEDWEVVESLDEISISLETIKNVGKWCRSTVSLPQTNELLLSYTLAEKETVENVSQSLGKDYNDIYLSNHLTEEGSFGGYQTLSIPIAQNITTIAGDIVEVINPKSIYGKDIKKDYSFENDDIVSLDYSETVNQSFETFVSLNKNHSEEFPNYGMDKTLIAGTNVATMSYPVILRQLFQTVLTDSAFAEVGLLDISKDTDSVSISIKAKTKLNEDLNPIILK